MTANGMDRLLRQIGLAWEVGCLPGRRQPSQGWKTIVRNLADGIAAVDFPVVPILTFERLLAFVLFELKKPCKIDFCVRKLSHDFFCDIRS